MKEEMIFKNYEAFYNMVLATAMMSNDHTPKMKVDGTRIIEFIGNAYGLDRDLIEHCAHTILDDMGVLSITKDKTAGYSLRRSGDDCTDEEILIDIKADVISELDNIAGRENTGRENRGINPSWFDYTHYVVYQPEIRFEKINTASATGNINTTRQVGILRALGIGCDVDFVAAERRLTQCALWGDIPSMRLLSYVYKLDGNLQRAELFEQVAELATKYLKGGITVLPKEEKDAYSEEARTYYIYISTIKQDVIYAHNKFDIDFSFIEALSSEELDYYDRMKYINKYSEKEWKNVTNSSERPKAVKTLGFN